MMSFLLRVLLIISGLWLIRRFLAALSGQSRRRSGNAFEGTKSQTGTTVRDPVCGMYMDPRLAVRIDGRQGTVFFCSEECRRKYVA